MNNAQQASMEMLQATAIALGALREQVVFLGGAVTGLLITDPAAAEIRFTEDVDVVIEIGTRSEYYKLEEELRSLGFTQPSDETAPICRWTISGRIIDVMPASAEILGFSNSWYSSAIQTAVNKDLSSGITI